MELHAMVLGQREREAAPFVGRDDEARLLMSRW